MKNIFFCILFFALIAPNVVLGNDYATDTSLWLKHDKITCWSLSNLEEHEEKSIFIFDYSRKVGKTLGKPWAVVESGKCYQIDSNYDQIFEEGENESLVYVFKQPISSEFQSILVNTTDAEANVEDFIQACSVGWRKNCKSNPPVVKIILSINDTSHSFGVSADAKRNSFGISFANFLPTKFIFGALYDGGFSTLPTEHEEKILNSSHSLQAQELRRSLLNGLQFMLNKCDTRIRIEEKGIIKPKNDLSDYSEVSDAIWRLESGKDFWIENDTPMFERIQLMGCSDEYHAFLKEKKGVVAELDQLMEILHNEHGDIEKRNSKKLKILTDFAEAETVPVIEITAEEVSYKTAPVEEIVDDSLRDEILPDDVLDDISLVDSKRSPVIKTEIEDHQEDASKILYLLYFAILPALGAGGGLIWLVSRKNKKPSVSDKIDNKNI